MDIPLYVKNIIEGLNKCGFKAYCVGGCVRDSILSKTPHDWDITTDAEPKDIKEALISMKTVDTGIKHGTVTVICGGEKAEVTTFRRDGEYPDHRHPENVAFSRCLKDDLARRDFTINAMAYDEKNGVIDLFGGKEDIEKGLVRAVGDPEERFSEDGLRILRALRFSSVLGFSLEENPPSLPLWRYSAGISSAFPALILASKLWITISHRRLLAPMMLVGLTALSVLMSTKRSQPCVMAA